MQDYNFQGEIFVFQFYASSNQYFFWEKYHSIKIQPALWTCDVPMIK